VPLLFEEALFLPLDEPLRGDVLKFFLIDLVFSCEAFLFAASKFSKDLFSFCLPLLGLEVITTGPILKLL
jgi:hypothetical protein